MGYDARSNPSSSRGRFRDVPAVIVTSPSSGTRSPTMSSDSDDGEDLVLISASSTSRDSFDSTSSRDRLAHEYPPTASKGFAGSKRRSKLVFLVPACVILLLGIAVLPPASVKTAMQKASEAVHKATAGSYSSLEEEKGHWAAEAEAQETVEDEDDAPEEAAATGPPSPPDDNPGVDQRPIEWEGDDLALRGYSWGDHTPHESLVNLVGKLDEGSRRTRNWLLNTRPASETAPGIGLGRTDPPAKLKPALAAWGSRDLPEANEGPGVYTGGSYTKYAELLQEWQTGRQVSQCVKGTWEESYTKMHNEMMQGVREAKLLEYHCQEDHACGGLADRMLGTMTAFLYSILTNRALSISWEHPAPFDLLFDSPNIDWSYPYHPNSTSTAHPVYTNATLVAQRTDFSALNWRPEQIDKFFPGVPDLWSKFTEPWIRFVTNRGFVLRAFLYPAVRDTLHSVGLKHDTAYACMLEYLLRPKRSVLDFVAQYTTLFSLPKFYTIAIQVRTGDDAMKDPSADLSNTVAKHQAYFTCADQVGRAYARSDQRVLFYLISDSENLKQDAMARFPDKVIVSGLTAKHTEQSKTVTGHSGAQLAWDSLDGMSSSLAEMWTLAGTDFQILTERSGFGKIPTWLRGKTGTTVTVPKTGSQNKKVVADCGLDTALVSFTELASSWSLG